MGPGCDSSFEGQIDVDTASELLDTIKTAVQCGVLGVDIDLSGVTSVDPTGLDVLVEGERAARNCDSAFGYRCHLRLLPPSRAADVALRAAGLDGYLDIVERLDSQRCSGLPSVAHDLPAAAPHSGSYARAGRPGTLSE